MEDGGLQDHDGRAVLRTAAKKEKRSAAQQRSPTMSQVFGRKLKNVAGCSTRVAENVAP
jgi:hypothetical protein